jgi:hypothetical protein
MKKDVEGATTVNEHLLEPNVFDDWIQNEGEATWF